MAKKIRYTSDDFSERNGEIVERNGNLTLVRDEETGKESYRAPFEITPSYGYAYEGPHNPFDEE